ncbi:MAG TPA: hypothetical protein VHY31_27475 [Streptosporangiaceae bacterium]|nr:hypothetical protein [Streptosporangiaceae bacterium]
MDARRPFGGLLRQRGFRRLWIGETVSQLGNAMAVVGVPLVAVVVLHASTFVVGVLTAAGWLPWLVRSRGAAPPGSAPPAACSAPRWALRRSGC